MNTQKAEELSNAPHLGLFEVRVCLCWRYCLLLGDIGDLVFKGTSPWSSSRRLPNLACLSVAQKEVYFADVVPAFLELWKSWVLSFAYAAPRGRIVILEPGEIFPQVGWTTNDPAFSTGSRDLICSPRFKSVVAFLCSKRFSMRNIIHAVYLIRHLITFWDVKFCLSCIPTSLY